jgi:hypothetical protein
MKVTISSTTRFAIHPEQMKHGQIGKLVSGTFYVGKYLLRTYSGFVLLEDPGVTWTCFSAEVRIELLPVGTLITLEIE